MYLKIKIKKTKMLETSFLETKLDLVGLRGEKKKRQKKKLFHCQRKTSLLCLIEFAKLE